MQVGELTNRHLAKRITLDQTDPSHSRSAVTGVLRRIEHRNHRIRTNEGTRWERRTTLTLVIDFLGQEDVMINLPPDFELDEPGAS